MVDEEMAETVVFRVETGEAYEFGVENGRVDVDEVLSVFRTVRFAVRGANGVWKVVGPNNKIKFAAGSEYTIRVGAPAPAGPPVARVVLGDVLKISSEELEFLDGFLVEGYRLEEMDAEVPIFGGMPRRQDFTHAPGVKQHISCAKNKLQEVIVVSGTSGWGKTRSLYDLFSEEYGLYFVMSAGPDGGSDDMFSAVQNLRRFMTLNDKTEHNKTVVAVHVMLLLACRMVIYNYCKRKGADPRQWLLLQVACRGIGTHCDVFNQLFQRALRILPRDRDGICSQHAAIQEQLVMLRSTKLQLPMVAVDEAQEAVYFWSNSREWLPLANPLVQALKEAGHMVVVIGTGLTLYFKDVLRGSGEKMIGASAWDRPAQMEFARRFEKLLI